MPSPKALFETLSKTVSQNKGAFAALGVAIGSALSASTFFHLRSEGALEGVAQQIRTARVAQLPENRPVSGVGEFKNTLTGTPGQFELMGRDSGAARPCFSVGITGGDYTMINSSLRDSNGRVHQVSQVTRICP